MFDVFGYLKKMRGLRRGLVETLVSLNQPFDWDQTNLHNSKRIILFCPNSPTPNIEQKDWNDYFCLKRRDKAS